jgi:hypothetical protein
MKKLQEQNNLLYPEKYTTLIKNVELKIPENIHIICNNKYICNIVSNEVKLKNTKFNIC